MSSLQSAIMIIMGEISLILVIVMCYLAYRYLQTNRNISSAILKLVNKIRDRKDDRVNILRDFLMHTCHYSEEHANSTAAELIKKEHLFYNGLMQTYMHRNPDSLINLDTRTEEIIDAYRNLITGSEKTIINDSRQELEIKVTQLSNTINELTSENETLSGEVDRLQREMEIAANEYSFAYRDRRDDGVNSPNPAVETSPAAAPLVNNDISAETDTDAPDSAGMDKPAADSVSGMNDNVDDMNAVIDKDLEALAAELDYDTDEDEINPGISLDGLDDDIVDDTGSAHRNVGRG